MASPCSPLRYPGGKQILAKVLGHLIELNGCEGGTYAEPYAGGAGAALSLLYAERVERLLLNDADPCIHAFWQAVLHKTEGFLKLIRDTPLSVDEWQRQRAIYLRRSPHSILRLGFATFYLNRCNRSGIIGNAGLIGGIKQTGKWKLDARFNRDELMRRISRVALYGDRIHPTNDDAIDFLRGLREQASITSRCFVYLDPPYFVKGSQLYMNSYSVTDHQELADYLRHANQFKWVLSYDNVPQIQTLYQNFRQVPFNLGYSARDWRMGKELLIYKQGLAFPDNWKACIPDRYITAADGIKIPATADVLTN